MKRKKLEVELSSIVDPSYLQAMHDAFSEDMQSRSMRVATAILDENARPVTFEFNHCDFCREVRKSEEGVRQCRNSDRKGIKRAKTKFKKGGKIEPIFWVCDRGLVDFCAPIAIDGRVVAYFFGGQFRCSCKLKKRTIKTPEKPTLGDLPQKADPIKINISELNNKFNRVQKLNQQKFDELRKDAEAFMSQLNSVIRKLYESRNVKKAEDFMEKAVGKQDIDALFDLIVDELPDMMDARYSSIFTVQEDEHGNDRLVLRKTSYPDLKPKENSAYYELGEGLTGWVWANAESLRLKDVNNGAELKDHGDDLEWKGKHNDSDEHKGFLAVPMRGRGNKVIGVIRMPHKIRKPDESEEEEKGFTKHDEIFLNFLGRYLAWAIECQSSEDKYRRIVGSSGLVSIATKLARARSYRRVLDVAIKSSLLLFGGTGKKHFVNILERDNQHWRVERVEGSLGLNDPYQEIKGMLFGIEQGITGRAIREREACISSDLKADHDKQQYIPAAENGESAISAPLLSGRTLFGAISIVSDRKYEFSKERDLTLLDSLGKLVGASIKNAKTRRRFRRITYKVFDFIFKLWSATKRARSEGE